MRINTLIEFDIETGQVLRRECEEYSGPVALCKGPSENEKKAYANADADRARRDEFTGKAEATFDDYDGPAENTDFYKTTVANGREATARNYNDARTQDRLRARLAGFGYEQPASEFNDRSLNEDEAQDLADVDRQALAATYDRQMNVAAARTGEADMYGGQGLSYFGQGANLENQRLQRRAMLMKSLISAGTNLATAFIPKPKGGGSSND